MKGFYGIYCSLLFVDQNRLILLRAKYGCSIIGRGKYFSIHDRVETALVANTFSQSVGTGRSVPTSYWRKV